MAKPTISIGTVAGDNIVNGAEAASFSLSGSEAGLVSGHNYRVAVSITNSTGTVVANHTLSSFTAGTNGAANWSDTESLSAYANGQYTVTANLFDLNTSSTTAVASSTRSILLDKTANISINPVAGDWVVNGAEAANGFAITGTTDAEFKQTVTVKILSGATVVWTGTAMVDNTGAWSAAVSKSIAAGLGNGSFTVSADVTDQAGNAASASHGLGVDTVAPGITLGAIAGDNDINKAEAAAGVTLSGTTSADVGQTVTVSLQNGVNVALSATATVGVGGAWSVNLSPADLAKLHDGAYTAVATIADPAGNAGTATIRGVVLDTQAPAAPVITTTVAAQTNLVTLQVQGTAEAGSTVELFDGATSLGKVAVGAGGAWSKTISLTDGHDYSLTATDTDAAGNTGPASSALAFHDDRTAPNPPSITTTVGAQTSATSLQVQGTAEAGSTVELFDGTTSLGKVTADGVTGAWSDTISLTNGHDYSLTAKATDAAGNTSGASNALAFHDNQALPPAPTITTTVAAQTNATSLDVQGTAEPGSSVELFDGTTSLGTVTADATTGAWSKTISLTDGHDYSLTAKETNGGNTGPASSALTFHDDQTAPGAPSITTTVDAQTKATSLDVQGTAEAGSSVELFDGATSLGKVTADATTGAWSKTISLTDGHDYSLTATATDAAGNTGSASSALTFHDDQTAPGAPSITTTVDAQTKATSLDVQGTAEAGSSVELFDGTTSLGKVTADATTGAWSKTISLTDGHDYSLTATATDAAGNTGSASSALTFHDDQTAPGAPTISTMVDAQTKATSLDVQGTAEAGSSVELFDGTTSLGKVTADATTGAWSKTISLTDGHDYSLTATATDAAGNTGSASSALTFHDDQTAPGAPSITTTVDAQTKATSLDVQGTAEAGSSVELFDGATSLGKVTADATTGAWSKTISLTDGHDYSLTATATDAAGNTGSASSALTFHDDQTAPGAPSITTTVDAQTKATSLDVQGTAEAGSSVELFDGTTSLGKVTADATTGAWSKTISLTDGHSYSLTATATDAAGNTGSASSALTFHDDQTAPGAPTISTTVDAQTKATSLDVQGTAEAGSSVELFDGATSLGKVTADATTGAWSKTISLTDGHDYSLTATATDAAGNTGSASSALTFHDDQTAPGAPTISTTVGAQTKATSLDVQGTAEAGSSVELFDGTTSLGKVTADATTGAWSKTISLTDGHDYSLTATATDAAGNTGSASSALTFHDDQTAPGAPTISTTVGAQTKATSLDVQGTAEAGSSVELFDGTTSLGKVTADATTGAWSKTISLTDGHDYSLTATATDAAGNTGSASSALTFHDDQTAPGAPSITTTVDAQTKATSLDVQGTAEAGSSVELFDGATSLGKVTADATTGAWSKTISLTDGHDYSLTATATDAAGNTGSASSALTFHDDQTAPGAPSITTTVDAQTKATSLDVQGTAEAGSSVELFDGATSLGKVTADATTGAWSKTISLTDGHSYSLTATATDAAGNTGSASSALTFLDDQTAPGVAITAQTLTSDTGISSTDRITSNGAVTLTGTMSDADGVSKVEIFDGSTDLGSATLGSGTWSFATTLGEGSHTLHAVATDLAGNTASTADQPTILVDTTAPAAPVITPSSLTFTVNPGSGKYTYNFSGTAEVGSQVKVGVVNAVNTNGAFSFTQNAQNDGVHSYAVTATDTAGNVSAATNVTFGSSGADTISASAQTDIIRGLSGADQFNFTTVGGADHITDFVAGTTAGHDVIKLTGVFADYATMLSHTTDVSGNAVIDLGGGASLTLDGVLKASLNTADFLF